MWIVKTLGRRTRNGVDRVYSVNGTFITQDLDDAAEAAIEAMKQEIAGNTMHTLPPLPKADVAPQERADYWNGTWRLELAS